MSPRETENLIDDGRARHGRQAGHRWRWLLDGALAGVVLLAIDRFTVASVRGIHVQVAVVHGGFLLGAAILAARVTRNRPAALADIVFLAPPLFVAASWLWHPAPILVGLTLAGAGAVVGWRNRRLRERADMLLASAAGGLSAAWLASFFAFWYDARETPPRYLFAALLVGVAMLGLRILASWWRPSTVRIRVGVVGALVLGVVLVQLAGSQSPSAEALSERDGSSSNAPIVLIVVDTMRADRLGVYGGTGEVMPLLEERLAAGEFLALNATATAPGSLSSHASMFTGLAPPTHGAHRPLIDDPNPPAFGYPLREDVPTVAEILSAEGYRTVGISGNFGPLDPVFGLSRGFQSWSARPEPTCAFLRRSPWWPVIGRVADQLGRADRSWRKCDLRYRRADAIVDQAIRVVGSGRTRPLFLFVNLFDPHAPYDPLPGFVESGRLSEDLPRGVITGALRTRVLDEARDLPETAVRHYSALYDGELAFVDLHLDRLLSVLESDPRWDEMMVIITSDHGEAFGEHETLDHSITLYEELIEVPLLIKGGVPHRLLEKSRGGSVSSRELFEVMLEHAAVPVQSEPATSARAWAYRADNYAEISSRFDRELRAVRRGRWKLIEERYSDQVVRRLFDLESDPDERHPLEGERFEPIEQELLELLGPRAPYRSGASAEGEADAELLDRLRALGYVR